MKNKDAKTLIMNTSETLFLKHGFRRVSVEEICRSANVSRKTFYVYFANKEALIISVLDKMVAPYINEVVEIMNSDVAFSEKMMRMTELKLDFSKKLSMDFINDLMNSDEVSPYYHKIMDENVAMARTFFANAQEKGEIRSGLDIDFTMLMLNYQIELCSKQEFLSLFKDVESMVRQMSEMFLFGIVENSM